MSARGLSKVVDEVVEKAIEELESSFEHTVREVESTVRRVREETLKAVDDMIDSFEKRSETTRSRIMSLTQVKIRGKRLQILEEYTEKVVEAALRLIAEKAERGELDSHMERMLREAVEVVKARQVKVYTSIKLRERLRKIVERMKFENVDVHVEDEPVETVFGLVVKSADGSVNYDNRIEARLARLRPEIKRVIADLAAK